MYPTCDIQTHNTSGVVMSQKECKIIVLFFVYSSFFFLLFPEFPLMYFPAVYCFCFFHGNTCQVERPTCLTHWCSHFYRPLIFSIEKVSKYTGGITKKVSTASANINRKVYSKIKESHFFLNRTSIWFDFYLLAICVLGSTFSASATTHFYVC